MISLRHDVRRIRRGTECGIFGFSSDGKTPSRRGRFQLYPDLYADDGEDPALEGDDALELELEARRLGATSVVHWYEP